MKKIILSIFVLFGLLLIVNKPALASTNWDLTGTFIMTYDLSGSTYAHSYTIDNVNLGTGDFSGIGFYVPNLSYTEDINGNISGSNITFHVLYTGINSGYYVDGTGVIASDGSMSGTAVSSSAQNFTWSVPAGSATLVSLDWGSSLSSPNCNVKGSPIINVTEKITNDVDSAVGGTNWAFDDINRLIKVWQVTDSSFCALVKYEGKYTTIAGPSPQGTGTVPEGWTGSFQGGYKMTIEGTLIAEPTWSMKGNVGTYDYNCDAAGICTRDSWLDHYFNVTNYDQPWWGWIYHGGEHGTWVNASTGNLGDIKE